MANGNPVVAPPQPPIQFGATETYSENILGPVFFYMYDLRVEGGTEPPPPPLQVARKNSPYIIATNEEFTARVKIKFNDSKSTKY